MRCDSCTSEIPTLARSDARYCSTRCRVAAHRRRSLPRALTSRARWVRHSAAKVPLTIAGRAASSTNPRTWATYQQARAATAGVGLGFVLDGDGVICLDLDHCLAGGVPVPWARQLLDALPATYIEVSPSGDGLHVWGHGEIARGYRTAMADGGSVEAYGWGRYITVTGRRWADAPSRLADLSAVLASLR